MLITCNEILLWSRDCEIFIAILDSSPVSGKDSGQVEEKEVKDHFSECVTRDSGKNEG